MISSAIRKICSLLIVCYFASVSFAGANVEEVDKRIFAGWLYAGSVYYFYPDGLFVKQGTSRREFVTIGRWEVLPEKILVLYEEQPRNTTLSPEKLSAIRARRNDFKLLFESDLVMDWVSITKESEPIRLGRVKDLPDRTENIYWGLGDENSYRRGLEKVFGRPKQK